MDFIAEHINLTRLKLNMQNCFLYEEDLRLLANLSNLTELGVSAFVFEHDAVAYALSHFKSLQTIEMNCLDGHLTLDISTLSNHWVIEFTENGRNFVAKQKSVQ